MHKLLRSIRRLEKRAPPPEDNEPITLIIEVVDPQGCTKKASEGFKCKPRDVDITSRPGETLDEFESRVRKDYGAGFLMIYPGSAPDCKTDPVSNENNMNAQRS
jgi:hypothetical protein